MGSHILSPVASDESADTVTHAMDGLRRLVRVLRLSAGQVERDVGLSGAQLFVLQQVDRNGPSSINQLAERTHTHQSSVSVVVTRLIERGLVMRTPCAQDRRRAEVTLTVAGQAVLRDAPDVAQTRLIHGLTRLSDADRAALVRGLDAWVKAIGAELDPAELFFEPQPTPPRRAP